MKIVLNTAACDNSGRFLDAGTEVTVGTGKDAIAADRAKMLVDSGQADEVKAKAAPKANSDKSGSEEAKG